jgi:acyl carrier protein
VLAREDVAGEKRLVAYVVPGDNSAAEVTLSVERLREYLKPLLPDHMVPSAFVMLENLPLTANGKLDRSALPAPGLAALVSRQYEAPRGELEELLAEVWRSLLHVERVGRRDNFFELGGHSLSGMRMIARVAEQFALQLSIAVLFQYPTIQQMAQLIESLLLVNAEPPVAGAIGLEEGVI